MAPLIDTSVTHLLAQGEGLVTKVLPTWVLPPGLVVLAALAGAAYVGYNYYRERGMAGWKMRAGLGLIRFALLAIVVLMLYGWMRHRHKTDLPDLVIAIDDSESMAIEDQYPSEQLRTAVAQLLASASLSKPTRLHLAQALLVENDGELLARLRERYNLKFFRLGGSARVLSGEGDVLDRLRQLEPQQPTSELGSGLRDILETQRGRPTAAMILLTDGITTVGRSLSEAAEYARRKNVPLYVVGLGNEEPARDLRLTDLLASEMVFVDDVANFDVKLSAEGFDGESVVVRLKREDQAGVLDEQTVVLQGPGAQSVRLSHRPGETGEFEYTVEVEQRKGEINFENNRQSQQVAVRDETIRVLLAQGYPNYEFRYLKSLLGRQLKKSDPAAKSIELTTVLQEADLAYATQDETAERLFPVNREELFRYDVLILGDLDPSMLSKSSLQDISDFVQEHGGGVVFIAGPRSMPMQYRDTPLESLFPFSIDLASAPPPDATILDSFRMVPTPLGLATAPFQLGNSDSDSYETWRKLPGMYWMLETADLRPAARVLAEHPTRTGADGRRLPVILMQYVGAGKVVTHLTEETWRWRFRAGDYYFARYWIQLIRYLSRVKLLGQSRQAELTLDRSDGAYRRGDPVYVRLRFVDERQAPPQEDGVTIILEREGGRRKNVQLAHDPSNRGVFETTLSNLAEGSYRIWVATPTLEGKPPAERFVVTAPPGETARVEMDAADLRRAATVSRGKFYQVANVNRLLDDLPDGRQVRIESLPPEPVWNHWGFPLAFVGLIVAEWLLRKRAGML
ncbi:VWA domain-containing protein [Lignipirellula cremea]|uniref:VWFA domain-containing protein n=1 Tax=Lignipirellula cremea TaxID=2528010 RepID=A0A518DNQ6_9BACT|nr:VWA domain-containing protein [Lignipirellula cremea]QDU93472.1 hypothetical protein Pla8534_12520 [Lignipirellula cremea]